LTAAADVVNSTAPLQTTVFNDTIDGNTVAGSWANSDQIDAGVGIDTLNTVVGADVTVDGTTTKLDNVEVLNLGASVVATINLDKATGVTDIWAKASTADLSITNVAKTVAIGVD